MFELSFEGRSEAAAVVRAGEHAGAGAVSEPFSRRAQWPRGRECALVVVGADWVGAVEVKCCSPLRGVFRRLPRGVFRRATTEDEAGRAERADRQAAPREDSYRFVL